MRKICFFFIFLIAFKSVAYCQNNSSESDKKRITDSLTIKIKKSEANSDSLKKLITENLQANAAKKITTKIESAGLYVPINTLQHTEKKAEKKQSLYEAIKLLTSLNPQINFSTSADKKEMTGTILVSKSSIAAEYLSLLRKMIADSKIYTKNSFQSSNAIDLKEKENNDNLKKNIKDIENLYQVVSLFDVNLIDTNRDLDEEIDKLKNQAYYGVSPEESPKLQLDIMDVQKSTVQKNYVQAIKKVNILANSYPSNEIVKNLKFSIYDEVEKLKTYQLDNEDPFVVIEAINYLEKIDSFFIIKFAEKKNLTQQLIFSRYMELANTQYKSGNYIDAKANLEKIETFKQIDPSAFLKLSNDISHAIAKEILDNASSLINDKNYTQAYDVLKSAKQKCTLDEDLNRRNTLQEEVISKAVEFEIKKAKSAVPNTWQFQLGYGLQEITTSNPTPDFNIEQTPVPYYLFGVFRKLNVKMRKDGKPSRGASLIGIKLAMGGPTMKRNAASDYPLTSVFNTSYIEPQFSLFMLRFLDLSVGKIFNLKDINGNPVALNTYYAGFKPRIGNLHFNLGVKYYSDGKAIEYIGACMSAQLAINFKRKISHEKIVEIKTNTTNLFYQ